MCIFNSLALHLIEFGSDVTALSWQVSPGSIMAALCQRGSTSLNAGVLSSPYLKMNESMLSDSYWSNYSVLSCVTSFRVAYVGFMSPL